MPVPAQGGTGERSLGLAHMSALGALQGRQNSTSHQTVLFKLHHVNCKKHLRRHPGSQAPGLALWAGAGAYVHTELHHPGRGRKLHNKSLVEAPEVAARGEGQLHFDSGPVGPVPVQWEDVSAIIACIAQPSKPLPQDRTDRTLAPQTGTVGKNPRRAELALNL